MIKRIAASNLFLYLDKTKVIKFITKNSSHSALSVGCKEAYIRRNGEYKVSWFTN